MEKRILIPGKRKDGRDSAEYVYRAYMGYVEVSKEGQLEPYRLTLFDGMWACNCLGFMYRRECKHIKHVPWNQPPVQDKGPYTNAGLIARLDTDNAWRIKAVEALLASNVGVDHDDIELFQEVQALAKRGEPLSLREQSLVRVKLVYKYVKPLMALLG